MGNMLRQNSQKDAQTAGAESPCSPSCLNGLAKVRESQKNETKAKQE